MNAQFGTQLGFLSHQYQLHVELQKMRAIKRTKTRDKREQAHREALRAMQNVDTSGGPRNAAGRIPGAFAADSLTKAQQKVNQATLYSVLL